MVYSYENEDLVSRATAPKLPDLINKLSASMLRAHAATMTPTEYGEKLLPVPVVNIMIPNSWIIVMFH
ncbi:hypothetical protein JTB14_034640 [Gonioctena quinquepunctata]|nr:hypothetical protein JTB14_034640 [Gonioctena quinquepunctata]